MEQEESKNDALLSISRVLGYSVVLMCFFMKLPQILAIYSAKSSKGINLRGCWMEIGSYLIGASYGYYYSFHISTYGELVLLAIQSSIIIYMVVYYGNLWNRENGILTLVVLSFVATSLLKIVPATLLYLLLLSTLPMAAASKLAQIREVYQAKSQGDVSVLMWSLASYGCSARLFTTYIEIKDMQIFLNFLIALILNALVVVLCLYYGKSVVRKKE